MKCIFPLIIGYLKKYRSVMTAVLFLLTSFKYSPAQNTNVPNKIGPMGIEVNTQSGNTFIHRTDTYIPARQLDFDISFSYNSYAFDENKGYGNGWLFEYAMYYTTDSSGNVTIIQGDGREDVYTISGSQFIPPVGFFDTLSQYQPGKYLLKTTDGTKFYFDNSNHKRLTKIAEPNGNFLNFGYIDSLVTSISNAAGQTITLNYAGGKLTSITDANAIPAQTYTYTYDAYGNLTKVTDAIGETYKYSYLLNGPLSALTDKNNNVADIIYYEDYSAREIITCNSRTSFSYDSTTATTTIIDFVPPGQNQVSTYIYNEKGWLARLIGSCCGYDMTFTYDNSGNLLERKDAKGNIFKYTYDNRGNYLTITDPRNSTTTYTYSPGFDNVTSITDPLGNVYTGVYNANGNLTQITRPDNQQVSFTYGSNGDLLTMTDANNHVASVTYDAYGYPTKISMPLNADFNTIFDARGNVISNKDPNGNIYSYQYDSINRVVKITDALNHFQDFTYDKAGNLTSYTDRKGFKETFNYDASDRIVSCKNANGITQSFVYDAIHNLISFSDELGKITTLSYDNQNRLINIKDAIGNGFSFTYDANGNMASSSGINGNNVSYTYDELDRLVSGNDVAGSLGSLTYDKNGNIVSFTNGAGISFLYAYDNLDRLVRATDPLGNSRTFTYDNSDNLLTVKDKNNHVSSYTYNAQDRVTSFTDNNNNVISAHYDSTGNLTSLTDQNGNITRYQFDVLNRLVSTTYPDGSTLAVVYDNNGNVVSKQLRDGSSVIYSYDSLDRRIAKDLPNGEHFSYLYDTKNRLLATSNASGTISFVYDEVDRVLSENFNGHLTSYSYDVPGRKLNMTYADGTILTRSYDQRKRLTGLSYNGQSVTNYQYNNLNLLSQANNSNGVTTSYQYDASNRITSIGTNKNYIPSLSFQYDNEANRTVIERLNVPQSSETFSYDAGNRLVGYKQGTLAGNTISSPVIQNSYTYDAVGTRISANLNGITNTYTTNNLNQYTHVSSSAQNTSFTYDGNGNQTYDGNFYMRYDPQGKKLVDSSASSIYRYQYDALGRRIQTISNGITTKYYFAGLQQTEERDAAGNLLAKHILVSTVKPVVRIINNQRYFYYQNHLSSTEAITDSTGQLVEWYKYQDFGKPSVFNLLNDTLAMSSIGNKFLFTGQQYDYHNHSYNFHYRNYSPATGTFLQPDPIGYADQMGMYQYLGNNPANDMDLLGLHGGKEGPPCPGKEEHGHHNKVGHIVKEGFEITHHAVHLKHLKIEDVENLRDAFREEGLKKLYQAQKLYSQGERVQSDILAKEGGALLDEYNTCKDLLKQANHNVGKLANGLNRLDQANQIKNLLVDGYHHENGAKISEDVGNVGSSFMSKFPAGSAFNMTNWAAGKYINMLTGEENESAIDFVKNTGIKYNRNVAAGDGDYQLFKMYENQDETRKNHKNRLHRFFMIEEAYNRLHNLNDCPPNKKNRGKYRLKKKYRKGQFIGYTIVLVNHDPNIIIGPNGVGNNKWVSVNDRLPYTVLFANDTIATAPVKVAKIIYPIDPKQDAATFQLSDFGFNNHTFAVPANTNAYYQRLDLRDSLGLYVDVTAGLDGVNHQAFWIFESIDPTTLLPTNDPLKGFLLTHDNNNPASGNGFVNFTIKPINTANTGDTISAYASIVFDSNDTIPTNRAKNTIDALPPVSSIADLPNFTPDTEVSLSYTGADDPGGSGIKWYSIYVSDNNSAPGLYVANFGKTDTTFKGIADHTYKFYISATDSAGNIEPMKYVDSVRISSGEMVICPNGSTALDSKLNGATYQWQVNTGTGFTNITNSGVYSHADSAILYITNAPSSMYGYQYRCLANGSLFSQTFVIKFEMKWEGTVSNAWGNPANWSCGSLPDSNTDVIVNGGKVYYPQVNSNITIRTLTTNAGSLVNVNPGFTLTIIK